MTHDQEPGSPSGAPLPEGVGRTALGVALARAVESARPDRLFDDPYASVFLRAAVAAENGPRAPRAERTDAWAAMAAHLVLRTAYFDDYLRDAVGPDGGCTQVVLLAAGLDARAFRLDWPEGVRLFELDLPEMVAFKERVLAEADAHPRVERHVLTADLREDWAAPLRAAGFAPEQPTAWLVEGLLIYLDAADAAALLDRLGALSAPGSRLALVRDGALRRTREMARRDPAMAPATRLWRGGLGRNQAQWLRAHGWLVHETDERQLCERYGADRVTDGQGFLLAVRPSPAESAERPRRAAARLLVLDPDGSVFLQLHHDAEVGPHWVLPGGGLEPGEAPLAGALRETVEETGWTDVVTGPELWRWEHDYHRPDTGLVRQHEVIFLASAPHRDPVGDLTASFAADGILTCRWFTPKELSGVPEVLWPPTLVSLLEDLRRDGPPTEPIDLGYVPNQYPGAE
ncbi:SAM-dependent methyltransferase [Streptacidiphilus melanogenes]|uniref:SAM-dependent methyltransferase n=1 Tax=Streptacidiphilus melanogenes TaxID=411235 RepID=UPI0007C729E1|nr:SAM-dependent methyltransferase [Streptacidiphilus melanogenes]